MSALEQTLGSIGNRGVEYRSDPRPTESFGLGFRRQHLMA